MDDSILKLYGCNSREVKIFNDECMPPILHLKLSDSDVNLNLISITYLNDLSEDIPIGILNKCGIWVDVESKHLHKDIGFHRYKISGQCGDRYVDLYFKYRIQSDNPTRPYIYMKRGVKS